MFDREFVTIASIGREDLYVEFTAELDAGEAAAIALAIERDADLVLIDERDGRQVARRHGLPVTGVIGILMKAAGAGDIDIEAALNELREAGFWIADDLYQQAIDEVTDE